MGSPTKQCTVCGWMPTSIIPTARLRKGLCNKHYVAWLGAGRPPVEFFHPTAAASKPATSEADRRRAHARHAAKVYGVTLEEYDRIWVAQGGGCAICGVSMEGEARCHVDHNHATGQVRGFLCGPCNKGLGQFQDDPERLIAAARYLNPPKENVVRAPTRAN